MMRLLLVTAASLVACQDSVGPSYYYSVDSNATPSASTGLSIDAPGASFDSDGGPPSGAEDAPRPSGPCDLSGRWLVVTRQVTTALGTKSAAHEWRYYAITQSGAQATISKGLICGKDLRALSALSGNADFPKTWPAMMTNLSDTGRTATSSAAAGGCQVSFEKTDQVMSAAVSYYSNFANSLPTVSEKAAGNGPGWQDWDNDGHPGYTLDISGLASGQIYMVDRTWYVMSGAIAASANSFDLALDWDNEQDVLGVNGPAILSDTSAAVKDGDASQHFATFVRLTDAQATGDDSSICSAIRSLAPMLAPKASD